MKEIEACSYALLPKHRTIQFSRSTPEWLRAVWMRVGGYERAVINSLVCGWREISWKGSCLQSTSRSWIAYSKQSAEGDYKEAQFSSSRLTQWRNSRSLQLEDGYESGNLPETTRNGWGALSQPRNKGVARTTESGEKGRKGDRRKNKIKKRETKQEKWKGLVAYSRSSAETRCK